MSLLAGAHIFVGSISLAVSLLHLAIFLRRTESKVHLIFSITSITLRFRIKKLGIKRKSR